MKTYKLEFYKHPITRLWRWRIKASNGRKIAASSESYWNREDCEHNAEIVGSSLVAHFKFIKK